MKFPWQRDKPDAETITKAKRAAKRARSEAQKDWPAVRQAAGHAHALNERNGFAEAIRAAWGGKQT